MSLTTRIGRPLIAARFLANGLSAVRAPEDQPAPAGRDLWADWLHLPGSTAAHERANAIAELAGGAMLALGIAPRLAAVGLLSSLVVTAAGRDRFWEATGEERTAKQTQCLVHGAIAGGLLLTIGSTA